MDVLIVAAHPPELAGLRACLGTALQARCGETTVRAVAVGIGLCEAAVGATRALEEHQPRSVILTGTCGAYPGSGLWVGDVALVGRVCLLCPAVVEEKAEMPSPMVSHADADDTLVDALANSGLPKVTAGTTLAITVDDALAARLGSRSHCEIEHLEAFAVARACAVKGVRFAAVFGVANVVGSGAREQWRLNHVTAGLAAARCVAAWLQGGASGLDGPKT